MLLILSIKNELSFYPSKENATSGKEFAMHMLPHSAPSLEWDPLYILYICVLSYFFFWSIFTIIIFMKKCMSYFLVKLSSFICLFAVHVLTLKKLKPIIIIILIWLYFDVQ